MNPELTLSDINSKFIEYVQNNEANAEDAANFVYENLLEDVTMGFLFEFHHGLKTGLTELIEGEPEDEEPLMIVNSPECDVFGFSIVKKTPDTNCSCPNCERPVSATRFAPHLEKCMGMGRNSSRIASRRIASNSREGASYAGLLSDDDDDADWAGPAVSGDKRKRKLKSNGVRKPAKVHKQKVEAIERDRFHSNRSNGVASDAVLQDGGSTYDSMAPADRKNLLLQICGVVSEHTKKLCTRSMRCPQHTDEQRRLLRTSVLEEGAGGAAADEAGSPPDSSPSSTCSNSSRKRDKRRPKPKRSLSPPNND